MTTAEIIKYIDMIANIQNKYKLIEPEKPEIMVVRIACIAIVLVLPIILCMFIFQEEYNYIQIVISTWTVTAIIGFIVAFIGGYLENRTLIRAGLVPIDAVVFMCQKEEKKDYKIKSEEILSELNGKIKPSPHFIDLETARRYLMAEEPKQEYREIMEMKEYKKNAETADRIENIAKGEVFRTINKSDFPVNITDKDVTAIIFITVKRTEVYKKELEGKYKTDREDFNYTEKDLSSVLRNNPVIEEYINGTVKKVNEKLGSEVK